MARSVTDSQHSAVSGLEADERRLALELSHPDVASNVRVVADTANHTIGGETYTAVRFSGALPQDREGEIPQAQLRIDNVGRALMDWIEASNGGRGASVRMMVVQRGASSSEIVWEVTMDVGRVGITGEYVAAVLTSERIYGRPAVKVAHTPTASPGLY